MKLRTMFVLCFLLANCSPGYTFTAVNHPRAEVATVVVPVYVDGSFSGADKANIVSAITILNDSLNGYQHLDVVSTSFDMKTDDIVAGLDGIIIMQVWSGGDHPCSFIPVSDIPGATVLAWSDKLAGHMIWVLRDRIRDDQIKSIVLHELIHCDLGVGHIYEHVSIMNPKVNDGIECVDEDAMQSAAAKNGWDINHLNYCIIQSN